MKNTQSGKNLGWGFLLLDQSEKNMMIFLTKMAVITLKMGNFYPNFAKRYLNPFSVWSRRGGQCPPSIQ